MAHSHEGHSHGVAPGQVQNRSAFAIAVGLNLAMVVAEATAGVFSGSMALIADAGHNLSDVAGIVVAWWAASLAAKPARGRFTFGYRKSTILSALVSGLLLVFATGGIVWEALNRLARPEPVAGLWVIGVALVGVLINSASAMLFAKARKGDLNIRGAFLHLMGDAAVSLAVAISGALILWTGWNWVDPIMSLVVAAVVLWTTWGLLREALFMALDAAPGEKELTEIEAFLKSQPGVKQVHDLHVWQLSTTETALMAHLVRPSAEQSDDFLRETREGLEHQFGVSHVTLQVEQKQLDEECGC